MKRKDLELILETHRQYWENLRFSMDQYSRAYLKKMFTDYNGLSHYSQENIVVETADGYSYIESHVASLFPKAPAVVVSYDATAEGDPEACQAVANRFLFDQFSILEQGLRYSLIYPFAAFKLAICDRKRVIDSVEIKPVCPWDIVVDQEASRWENQRFVGHRYYIPVDEARAKWGNKDFSGAEKTDYLDQAYGVNQAGTNYNSSKVRTLNTRKSNGSTMLTFIEVFEMYDFVNDELTFFSPNLLTNDGVLESISPIPFRSPDDEPMSTLVPLYLGQDPAIPLRGSSTMGRIYSQLYEINSLRTFYARSVRKDTRLFVARKGMLDEEAKAQITDNIDNSVIEIDAPFDMQVSNIITPLQNLQMSNDFYRYSQEVRADLDRGSILSPLTRGQATSNATATEVSALTQYSATEIGRLARIRDQAVENIAKVYLMLVGLLLEAEKDKPKEVVVVEGKKVVLTPDQFAASFRVVALDNGATPLSTAVKRQRLVELLPVLLSLGVDKKLLVGQLVRDFELPTLILDKLEEAEAEAKKLAEAQAQQVPAVPPAEIGGGGLPGAIPVGGGEVGQEIRAEGQMFENGTGGQ
jgi:hypothetical protein